MLKRLKEDEPFPDDFWNFNVNQITGYPLDKLDVNSIKVEQKYRQI
jgi:hypothetical protein